MNSKNKQLIDQSDLISRRILNNRLPRNASPEGNPLYYVDVIELRRSLYEVELLHGVCRTASRSLFDTVDPMRSR